ncbi:hypothetical protein [uncultured Pseudomonas sp.]|uniref:hypothetical protein n=1 Tax=uncultured Pseudomonas sp. TaxID=114707 RepID=UPI0025D02A8C|nr:hypothetical protein [uncultured Pseudomonas sp.]
MSRKPATPEAAAPAVLSVATNFLPPYGKDSHLIALLTGATCFIDRNAGQGTHVPAAFRANAFRDGCTQVGDGEQAAPETEDELDETIRLIVAAIETMVAAGEPDTLHPDGRPVIEALSAKVGFTVSGPQYDKAFDAFEASL